MPLFVYATRALTFKDTTEYMDFFASAILTESYTTIPIGLLDFADFQ